MYLINVTSSDCKYVKKPVFRRSVSTFLLLVVATKMIILLQSLEAMSSKLVKQMLEPVYYQLKPLTHTIYI